MDERTEENSLMEKIAKLLYGFDKEAIAMVGEEFDEDFPGDFEFVLQKYSDIKFKDLCDTDKNEVIGRALKIISLIEEK